MRLERLVVGSIHEDTHTELPMRVRKEETYRGFYLIAKRKKAQKEREKTQDNLTRAMHLTAITILCVHKRGSA